MGARMLVLRSLVLRSLALLGLLGATFGCSQGQKIDDWIRTWSDGDGSALVEALPRAFPSSSIEEQRDALNRVARGEPTPSSALAAEALCRIAGLGDPLETASLLFNESDDALTEPQWFLWIAGYSYNWVCNSGLTSCYFEFDERQYADRVRVYEAIGARRAAKAMRDADRAFGAAGPPVTLAGRQAMLTDDLRDQLTAVNPRFWECGDEITTQSYLYALEHPEDFHRPE